MNAARAGNELPIGDWHLVKGGVFPTQVPAAPASDKGRQEAAEMHFTYYKAAVFEEPGSSEPEDSSPCSSSSEACFE